MQVKRVLNNNAVLVQSDRGEEIVLGKGVGFQRHPGDGIDANAVSKVFVLHGGESGKIWQLLKDMPLEYIQLASDVAKMARERLGVELSGMFEAALADHIYATVRRSAEGISIKNELLWEIGRYYPEELALGREAVVMIHERFGVQLPDDEAGFIALHLVNAKMEDDGSSAVSTSTAIIKGIENIVMRYYHAEFDTDSVYYARFLTHLKYFAERMIKGSSSPSQGDDGLSTIVCERYATAAGCTEKIERFLLDQYGYAVGSDERMYLTIHIEMVAKKSRLEPASS